MGTVATQRGSAVGVSGASSVLALALGWCDVTRTATRKKTAALRRVCVAETEAYLAVARMCSYLGDHRTDRTSALCPTDGKRYLKMENSSSKSGKCLYAVVISADPAGHESLNQTSGRTDGL